jgi:hypothetical protein
MENFINVALIAGAACLFIMINRRVFKKKPSQDEATNDVPTDK